LTTGAGRSRFMHYTIGVKRKRQWQNQKYVQPREKPETPYDPLSLNERKKEMGQ